MSNNTELKLQIKRMLVENLMLQLAPEDIGDDQLLFDPGGLGLDSVDALQIVVALDKTYGVKVSDAEAARKVLKNVDSIADAIAEDSRPPA
jgi:acyl carrier protein